MPTCRGDNNVTSPLGGEGAITLHEIISHLNEKSLQDIPAHVLAAILNERHPEWVRLSSEYRPKQETHSLRHIHLSSWLSKHR